MQTLSMAISNRRLHNFILTGRICRQYVKVCFDWTGNVSCEDMRRFCTSGIQCQQLLKLTEGYNLVKTMFDVALSTAGANVVVATSSDEKYPPENIIDGQRETFWTSTGLYPQEFVISFTQLMNLNSVKMESYNVKGLVIERSVQNEPVDFEPVTVRDMEATDNQLQHDEIPLKSNTSANHLRFTITSGYDHFVSVHRVHVDGTAAHT